MEITLEMIDAVRERSGASYEDARNALEQSNGSVVDALVFLEKKSSDKTQATIDKLKAIVKEGNVNKIRLKRGDQVLLTVPVNVGIVGGIVGLAAAPWWGVLAAAAAAYGFECKFEIVKEDGSTTDIF
ncbi:MAG: DUF4342 domain-containing protein [Oscillospiraceae bacterium]|nr:DUF4342 domain-containing protein [Oscillospiraceae bacterium]